ncbi:MAG: DUF4838 domain-containing protein [Clostridia bacterium]|nr:DUF4838 domain-containing protein [Clostridia bacterium]
MPATSLLIHPEELDKTWLDQLGALRVGALGLHPVGGKRADETLAAMLDRFETPEYRALLEDAESRGIEVTCEMHALRYLLPEDALAAHPAWQRVNMAGQRTPDFNLCPSCGEALDFLSERAAALYARLPGRPRRAALWLDDSRDAFCHCEKCRGISPSDQQMIVLHALLRGIRSVQADARLAYLAYFETLPAPTRRDLKDGLYLEFAPYQRDLTRPLEDAACEANRRETAPLPALLDFFGTEDATALDYWFDNSLLSRYTKPPRKLEPHPDVVRADMAFYRRLGFQRVESFACYLGADYRALYGLPDLTSFRADE